MPQRQLIISAPGKCIVAGEHAVVYGEPAVVMAVDRRLQIGFTDTSRGEWILNCTDLISRASQLGALEFLRLLGERSKGQFSWHIESDIPPQSGMGSSAALAVAVATMVVLWMLRLDPQGAEHVRDRANALAYEFECFQHGTPSGVDNTIVTYGGLLYFQRGEPPVREHLAPKWFPELIAFSSGQPVESTGEMVAQVRALRERKLDRVTELCTEIGSISQQWRAVCEQPPRSVKNRDKHVTTLLRHNDRCLVDLGVVSERAQNLIYAIESLGGGAKIAGAGGVEAGSGMILAYHTDPAAITTWLKKQHIQAWPLKQESEGVRWHESDKQR